MSAPRTLPDAVPRTCPTCRTVFTPPRKFPKQVYCCHRCSMQSVRDPAFNARVSRATAAKRGDALRGRGDGRAYPKLNGRHAHRAMAEIALGRKLLPGEVVHHKDEDRSNFALDNLEVLPSQADHARLHFTGTKQTTEHVRKRMEARRRNLANKGRTR